MYTKILSPAVTTPQASVGTLLEDFSSGRLYRKWETLLLCLPTQSSKPSAPAFQPKAADEACAHFRLSNRPATITSWKEP